MFAIPRGYDHVPSSTVIFGKEPVQCPLAEYCYCNVFGLCELQCREQGVCAGHYSLSPYSSSPKGVAHRWLERREASTSGTWAMMRLFMSTWFTDQGSPTIRTQTLQACMPSHLEDLQINHAVTWQEFSSCAVSYLRNHLSCAGTR